MGPHFFKCGKAFARDSRQPPPILFNGAALFQVRKEQIRGAKCDPKKVFNGAALFQVRKAVKDQSPGVGAGASSMGPHFFKCGKSARLGAASYALPLQWGRTFSSAESEPWSGTNSDLVILFNGAALFQVRKAIMPSGSGGFFYRFFNGAALFQVRKEIPPLPAGWRAVDLQWGRTFSSAES